MQIWLIQKYDVILSCNSKSVIHGVLLFLFTYIFIKLIYKFYIMTKTRDEADNEEAYWFVRWCHQRAQIKRLKEALTDIKNADISKLRQENITLKNTISQIRKDFIPEAPKRKRSYKGNNPNK